MNVLFAATAWLSTGLFGSWLVVHYVGRAHPELGLRHWSPFWLMMATLGLFNLICGIIYALAFRKPTTT